MNTESARGLGVMLLAVIVLLSLIVMNLNEQHQFNTFLGVIATIDTLLGMVILLGARDNS